MMHYLRLLVIILISVIVSEVAYSATVASEDFATVCKSIINNLKKQRYDRVLERLAADRVVAVDRYFDWTEAVKEAKERDAERDANTSKSLPTAPSSSNTSITLPTVESYKWIDDMALYENGFDKKQLLKTVKEYSEYAKNSFSGGPTFSLNAYDAWNERYLGPVIEGKIASGQFWYISLRQIQGKWKIWRFEVQTH